MTVSTDGPYQTTGGSLEGRVSRPDQGGQYGTGLAHSLIFHCSFLELCDFNVDLGDMLMDNPLAVLPGKK